MIQIRFYEDVGDKRRGNPPAHGVDSLRGSGIRFINTPGKCCCRAHPGVDIILSSAQPPR
jgi:hypothetical protein